MYPFNIYDSDSDQLKNVKDCETAIETLEWDSWSRSSSILWTPQEWQE